MDYTLSNLDSAFSQYFTTEFIGTETLTFFEKAIVQSAGEKRQRDFSTGRFCAKKALEKFGLSHIDILTGAGKEPLWPPGIVGSISHSGKLAGAVVAKADDVMAVGMDIETIGGVKPGMWDLIFTAHEQAFLNGLANNDEIWLFSTLLFSFKESFYKLQYPLTALFLDFKDVEIHYKNGDFNLYIDNEFACHMSALKATKLQWERFNDQVICVCYLSKT